MKPDQKQKDVITNFLKKVQPLHLFITFFAYMFFSIIVVILIDVFDLAGIRSFMESVGVPSPRIWVHIFDEKGFTEWLQWLSLSLLALSTIFVSGQLIKMDKLLGYFWFFIGIVAIIFLLEDGANTSHTFQRYMSYLVSDSSILNSRIIVYIAYMGFAIIPIIKYFKNIYSYRRSFKYLIAGYIFYGFAAIKSVFLGVFGINREILGTYILNDLLKGILNYSYSPASGRTLGCVFMDSVIEEPIELFAIVLLLCAIITFVSDSDLE